MAKNTDILKILMEGLEPTDTNIPSELDLLKNRLSESVRPAMLVEDEDEKDKEKDKDDEEDKKTKVKGYKDVQNAMDKDKNPTASSQVGVMKSIGIPDDEAGTNRALFNKKLKRKKNNKGSIYSFNSRTLAKIRAKLGLT
jgi:hypothetical protein